MAETPDTLAEAGRLRKVGRVDEALALLRDGLRRGVLDAAGHERAGRIIAREYGGKALSVRILGQCTTSWMVPVLTAVGWGRDQALRVTDGEYDNVFQELGHGEPADVVVLLPWTQRLFTGDRPEEERIAAEVDFWAAAWERRRGARLVQVGYDWTGVGPKGALLSGNSGGKLHLIRRLNEALRKRLPAGAAFIDLEELSGRMGRHQFYDARRYNWTRQPFSEEGTLLLTRQIQAAIRSMTTGPKKVLVLDLDNTLWGGVVGELGPLGVGLGESADGEAFRNFQLLCKGLAQRGVVLAVASKNNPEDAREPFLKNPDMKLALSDFAAFEAHWEPKARSLARIAESLRLGLDSFVFFDDNPAEREHIRQALPQVEVVEVPEDPSEYVAALENSLLFDIHHLTNEDAERSAQYQAEQQRKEAESAYGSLDDYLTSLKMRADLRPVDDADMLRVVQLLAKTNQFNLTTRRHSEDTVRGWMEDPRSILLTLRVSDCFGDHGLVGLILGVVAEEDTILVDTLLMSCRVIGRTVEQFLWNTFVERAMAQGFRRVRAEFIPTAKNAQVAELYPSFGLSPVGGSEGTVVYEAELESLPVLPAFVQLA